MNVHCAIRTVQCTCCFCKPMYFLSKETCQFSNVASRTSDRVHIEKCKLITATEMWLERIPEAELICLNTHTFFSFCAKFMHGFALHTFC